MQCTYLNANQQAFYSYYKPGGAYGQTDKYYHDKCTREFVANVAAGKKYVGAYAVALCDKRCRYADAGTNESEVQISAQSHIVA